MVNIITSKFTLIKKKGKSNAFWPLFYFMKMMHFDPFKMVILNINHMIVAKTYLPGMKMK